MITSLSKLTMRKYIDLVCGDTSVLTSRDEYVSESKLHETRKRLLYEYSRLSDNAGTLAMIYDHEKRMKAKAELMLFQVLNNLITLGEFAEVRRILGEYGIRRAMDDNQTAAEVGRLLKRAKTNVKKAENIPEESDEKEPSPDEIRSRFDRQAASLMTYFKFQIDFNTITASQFACMIDQANKEIKAKMAALRS